MEKELIKRISDFAGITKVEPVTGANEVSRIAHGVRIVGDISAKTDIRVDGCVEGKLFSEGRIIIGGGAVLKGSLVCSDVEFYGKMDGDLYVKGVLSVKSPAVINGNIHVCKLEVELGSQINGSCSMITDEVFNELKSSVITTEVPEYSVVKKGGNSMKLPTAKEEQAKVEAQVAARTSAIRPLPRSIARIPAEEPAAEPSPTPASTTVRRTVSGTPKKEA